MDGRTRFGTAAGLLVGLSFCFALFSWGAGSGTINVVAGWNLLGNSSSAALNVPAAFADPIQVTTVWKWVPAKNNWAFFTPLQADGGAAYAASKGYEFLSSIGSGEGFWVNAKIPFTAQLPAGTSVTSASFRATLVYGWNLIASGDNKTPSLFNQALSTAPPPTGTTPTNLITLWSWDAMLANWYFYAPSLEASGGTALGDYVTGKGYLNFGTKSLDQTTGFWVNRSAAPASINLGSTSVPGALPMSILILNGTGFDPTAATTVRFQDANQYSVDVRPIRVSTTSIAVAVPPYFNSTAAVFAPGTVSVKVIQTSASATRTSAALAGFQILDLPIAAGPAGAVTLNVLQALQAQATTLQTAIGGTALDSQALRASLANQATRLAPLITAVESVVQNASQRVSLGTLRGIAVDMGAAELRQTDRLLLGVFLSLGSGASGFASTGGSAIATWVYPPLAPDSLHASLSGAERIEAPVQLAFSGALDRLEIGGHFGDLLGRTPRSAARDALRLDAIKLAQTASSSACMQAESNTFAQCAQGNDPKICNSLAIVRAPHNNILCSFSDAVSTALTVVGAGLVGGVAIAGSSLGALASAGYMAYMTTVTGLFQIGIGGMLGQTSAAGRKLVEGGLDQLEDFVRDTAISSGVSAVAGDTAGLINDVATSAWGLGDVLFPATATTTTLSPTSTTVSSTTTTTIGYAACYAKYQTCVAQPACNPPADLITQNQCVNACLAAWNACY